MQFLPKMVNAASVGTVIFTPEIFDSTLRSGITRSIIIRDAEAVVTLADHTYCFRFDLIVQSLPHP